MQNQKFVLAGSVFAMNALLLIGCAGTARPVCDSGVETSATSLLPCANDGRDIKAPDAAVHRAMLDRLAERPRDGKPLSVCFTPGTPSEVIDAFNDRIFPLVPAFNQFDRWGPTALDPAGGGQGNPTTITYSFVPDGTLVDGFAGEPAAPSHLFADLNALYGSPAVWQPLFHGVFQRWGQLIGVHYIYEPSDDGVPLESADGLAGVRGDVRISGHPIDGNSGILAYNFFPAGGDMVVETSDSFFAQTFGDSIRLRNVISHEHGHGMGQAHVCPINQTKLMEPFVSVAYDGPREDDVRNGHRFYGDTFEPDNTPAQAHDLGRLASVGTTTLGPTPAPVIPFASLLSIDAAGEEDWFRVTLASPSVLQATAAPVGRTYEDAAQECAGQTGSCCSGTFTDSLAAGNLAIRIVGIDGVTVLADASANAAGAAETAAAAIPAGTYFVRVYETGMSAPPQMYNLTLETQSAAFTATLVSVPPATIAPGVATPLDILVTPSQQTLNVGASDLRSRATPSDPFLSTPLTALGGNMFKGELPGFACGTTPEYYFHLVGSLGTVVTLPASAPAVNLTSFVGTITTVFADDMEIDRGWTVGPTTATTGAWVRVDPNGTAAAPEDDLTPAPGTTCWVTGQGSPGGGVGEQDVDGGLTTLVSPRIDLSAGGDVTVSYFRWYSNGAGSTPYADVFRVEVSNDDGVTWTAAETIGPGGPNDPNTNPGWVAAGFNLGALGVTPTDQVRVRFIAEDAGAGSVVEAGLDDFVVTQRLCVPPFVCPADFNHDGQLNPDDLGDYITCFFTEPVCPGADFNGDGEVNPDDLGDYITAFFNVPC